MWPAPEAKLSTFPRTWAVEELTTYQYIIEQGGLKAVHRILLRLGRKKFGAPTNKVKAAIQESEDLPRLERMAVRLLTATSWAEVLNTR
jgi:hypothetical protein